jgi:hypothetical protein
MNSTFTPIFAVETFEPFNVVEDSITSWIPCWEARKAGLEFCRQIIKIKRLRQPTGGLDGGALNRLAIQALTGLSPEFRA